MATNSPRARSGTLVVLFALCLVLAGCGKNNVTKENFDKIENDMTLEQVELILGQGNPQGDGSLVAEQVGVDVTRGARPPSTLDYLWESGKTSITVTFRHGKVAHKRSTGF